MIRYILATLPTMLLKVANGYLPRVRLEYDRLREEKNWLEAELNSWKTEINNSARIYQDFISKDNSENNGLNDTNSLVLDTNTNKSETDDSLDRST